MNSLQLMEPRNLEILKNMYFKGLDTDELQIFLHACKKTSLDPFMKQIYAVMRWDSKLGKNIMTIQTGIDGYRLIAERTGKYAPGREPSYNYNQEGRIISSTAYVKKMTEDGTWHEVAATAFFDEYCQKNKEGRPTQFWIKMGHNQIAKCAEALALRKAFPDHLSGVYTQEEMQQAEYETVKMDQIIEDPKQIEMDLPIFLDRFPEEKRELVLQYLKKYTEHWKKTIGQTLMDYKDQDKFMSHFTKWEAKQ